MTPSLRLISHIIQMTDSTAEGLSPGCCQALTDLENDLFAFADLRPRNMPLNYGVD